MILVPEAEEAVSRWCVEQDSSAALGVRAHMMLLYSFAAAIAVSDDVMAKVADTVGGFGVFDNQLDEVRWSHNAEDGCDGRSILLSRGVP